MTTKVADPVIGVHDLTVSYQRKPALWGFFIAFRCACRYHWSEWRRKKYFDQSNDGTGIRRQRIRAFVQPSDDEVQGKVAYVPQRGTVDWDFPASVLDVVLMGRFKKRRLFSRLSKADEALALRCLEQVGWKFPNTGRSHNYQADSSKEYFWHVPGAARQRSI